MTATLAWVLLVVAGLLETVWATALKQSDGFTRFWPSAIGLSVAAASLAMLAIALKALPVGTAYVIWVGIGAGGVALAGIIAFGEPATPLRPGFIALILVGVVGLRLVEG